MGAAYKINKKNIRTGEFYANVEILSCGRDKIAITSSCRSKDENNTDSYCFSQSVSFLEGNRQLIKNYTYTYDESEMAFVYQASCLQDGVDFYVELESSNLGNCKSCEWYDYFTSRGLYLGSSQLQKHGGRFPKKLLPYTLSRRLLKARRVQSSDLATVAR